MEIIDGHAVPTESFSLSDKMRIILIAGEYPPAFGGVADYSFSLAKALAEKYVVEVWSLDVGKPEIPGRIIVRRVPSFSPSNVLRMVWAMNRSPGPKIVLLEYVAQSFGYKGLNIAFPFLLKLLRNCPLWIMFHEVEVSTKRGQSLKERVLAYGTQAMARSLVRQAARVFTSTSNWVAKLERYASTLDICNTPIPSNLPIDIDDGLVANARHALQITDQAPMFCHFGTYRMRDLNEFLAASIPVLLDEVPHARMLLLGRGGHEFRNSMLVLHPRLSERIISTGELRHEEVATYLKASSIALQPYLEGVTTRRGSLIASLGLGVAILTTIGFESEPLWRTTRSVAFAEALPIPFARAASALLAKPARVASLQLESRLFYDDHFALGRTVDAIELTLRGRC